MTTTTIAPTYQLAPTKPAWIITILTAASVLAHIWMLVEHSHGVAVTTLMVAMTLWCIWCAFEAALKPGIACLQRLLFMSLAMAAVHVALLWQGGGVGGHEHGHHAAMTFGLDSHVLVMLTIVALELLVAFGCGVSIYRRHVYTRSTGRGEHESSGVED